MIVKENINEQYLMKKQFLLNLSKSQCKLIKSHRFASQNKRDLPSVIIIHIDVNNYGRNEHLDYIGTNEFVHILSDIFIEKREIYK